MEADPGQLEQVLLNVTVKARDAMPDGGKLIIPTQTVSRNDFEIGKLPTSSTREFVLLSVTDSGVGIPAEQLLRIFDPFFATKPEDKVAGLGLATVDSIIRQRHGFIRVDSELDRGTRFRIWLQRASRSEREKHPSPSEPEAVGGSETVLVVEDDNAVREATAEFLASIGYRVLSARNGTEALQTLESHLEEIDLMITDVVMPAMKGTKLARLASAKRPGLKTLFVSVHPPYTLLRKGMKDLSANFLAKPFSLKLLAAKVKDALHEPARVRQPPEEGKNGLSRIIAVQHGIASFARRGQRRKPTFPSAVFRNKASFPFFHRHHPPALGRNLFGEHFQPSTSR